MSDSGSGPTVLQEPGTAPQGSVWMRGLMMLIVAAMFCVAQSVLGLLTLVQFILMVIAKGRPNPQIAGFGKVLAAWLAKAARFQTAESDVKPWPFTPAE